MHINQHQFETQKSLLVEKSKDDYKELEKKFEEIKIPKRMISPITSSPLLSPVMTSSSAKKMDYRSETGRRMMPYYESGNQSLWE